MNALAVVAVVAVLALPGTAGADIFVSPFAGLKFKGDTNDLDLGNGATDAKLSIGLSGVVLSDQGVGLETEIGYNPRFFERAGDLLTRSGVTTVFGNLLLALPISLTRESLRPYAVGGLGWVHASANDQIGFNAVSNDFLGLALGVGAIGFVSDTTGLRFDVRYLKSVSSADISETTRESARISFWRATIGLVFR